MRIAHIMPMISSRFGGPVSGVIDLAAVMNADGHESTVFSTNLGRVPWSGDRRKLTDDEMPANIEAVELELFDVKEPLRLIYSPQLGRRLNEVVHEYDVVHVHSLWLYPQYAGQRAARRAGVPYVVSPHGSLDPYLRSRGRLRKGLTNLVWQNGMLKHADALHITTREEGELIADVVPEVPHVLVPNGIWVDRFSDSGGDGDRFRREHMDGFDGPLVLFFGRVNYKKGIDILIRSCALVAEQCPDARVAVVGPDDEGLTPELIALAESLGVGDRFTFTGPLYGPGRADALAAADVWTLPSHTENFGIAVIEAMAAGLATVISPAVNLASSVIEAQAGLVEPNVPEQFGPAIARLLNDAQLRTETERRAVEYARRYDWSVIAPQYTAMFEACIAGAAERNPRV